MTNLKEKFEVYLAVQESGYYNMIDPRARELACEMNDIEISRADWIYLIANYSELKRELS